MCSKHSLLALMIICIVVVIFGCVPQSPVCSQQLFPHFSCNSLLFICLLFEFLHAALQKYLLSCFLPSYKRFPLWLHCYQVASPNQLKKKRLWKWLIRIVHRAVFINPIVLPGTFYKPLFFCNLGLRCLWKMQRWIRINATIVKNTYVFK